MANGIDGMSAVEDFKKAFWPHYRKHGVKKADGAVARWEGTLSDARLRDYFECKSDEVLSFLVGTIKQNYFAVDVDDHIGGGWVNLDRKGDGEPLKQIETLDERRKDLGIKDLRGWVPEAQNGVDGAISIVDEPASGMRRSERSDSTSGSGKGGRFQRDKGNVAASNNGEDNARSIRGVRRANDNRAEAGVEENKTSMDAKKTKLPTESMVPTELLLARYQEVVKRIGQEPSARFWSSRGVHLFWFFDGLVTNLTLSKLIKPMLNQDVLVEPIMKQDKLAEFLPTDGHTLRIPKPSEFLDAELKRSEFPGYAALKRYTKEELFGDELTPKKIQERDRRARKVELERKAKLATKKKDSGGRGSVEVAGSRPSEPGKEGPDGSERQDEKEVRDLNDGGFISLEAVEQAERACGPIENGRSNDQYLELVPYYVRGGLTEEETIKRFEAILDRSPGYKGRLKLEIRSKVVSSFRGIVLKVDNAKNRSYSQYMDDFVKWCVVEAGFEKDTKKRKSLEKFLGNLIACKMGHDEKRKYRVLVEAENEKHPGYKRIAGEGLYPLPSKLMHDWDSRYVRNLDILIKLGVMNESPYSYSTDMGQCKSYAIQLTECRITNGIQAPYRKVGGHRWYDILDIST